MTFSVLEMVDDFGNTDFNDHGQLQREERIWAYIQSKNSQQAIQVEHDVLYWWNETIAFNS